jgi:2-dehydro-3-deoxyphosphooctonate aldolase (KDO 8-P synthase)
VATGSVAGIFIEAHPDPDHAPCDGPNMLSFAMLPKLIAELKALHLALQ